MAILGKWIGPYVGDWLGTVDGGGPAPPSYVDAALTAAGLGLATLTATQRHAAALVASGLGTASLTASVQQPTQPDDSPDFGYYKRRLHYQRAKRMRRDEETLLMAIIN